MENSTKFISLKEISYPVYKVGTESPIVEDGVKMYVTTTVDVDTNEVFHKYAILDDINEPGDTLAIRRLRLKNKGVNLKRLNKAVIFPGSFIQLSTPRTLWIDSKGLLFRYNKTKSVKLTFRKITKVIDIPTGGVIIEVEGMHSRFKCLYKPTPQQRYAGILVDGLDAIFYGLYTEKYDDTRRRI